MRVLQISATAKEDLAKLDKPTARQVFSKLKWLAENFDIVSPEPLSGEFKGNYKLRIGDYRAIYCFNKTQIIIQFIRHRREVYKSK